MVVRMNRSQAYLHWLTRGTEPITMQCPVELHLALHETADVFTIDLSYDYPGPRGIKRINGYLVDWQPSLTEDRLLEWAAHA